MHANYQISKGLDENWKSPIRANTSTHTRPVPNERYKHTRFGGVSCSHAWSRCEFVYNCNIKTYEMSYTQKVRQLVGLDAAITSSLLHHTHSQTQCVIVQTDTYSLSACGPHLSSISSLVNVVKLCTLSGTATHQPASQPVHSFNLDVSLWYADNHIKHLNKTLVRCANTYERKLIVQLLHVKFDRPIGQPTGIEIDVIMKSAFYVPCANICWFGGCCCCCWSECQFQMLKTENREKSRHIRSNKKRNLRINQKHKKLQHLYQIKLRLS